ncbi:SH3 domain-containing protein [Streptomyces sp. DH24]|uniref:SH3 domain-containing protein n=1 Tax=Streptomyces sp. DH24 TaxID=3040123 RepID=UPI0024436893|nr:SH3 domain-containing protein [Streptomyces sp. DH24]MDG9716533.1 SH3 domain-containing protein [Streptomyces sp. DH24]
MSLRSRLAITAAVGMLAASAAATPAVATDDWSDGTSTSSSADGTGGGDGPGSADALGSGGDGGGHHGHHDGHGTHKQRYYKGVVTARTLPLRSAPNRGSQIIRYAHKGDIVKIFCKTGGETVDGNPLWYLLPDGTWAWGSARYIDNIGPAPRWC